MDLVEDDTTPEGAPSTETKETQDSAQTLAEIRWVIAEIVRLRAKGLTAQDTHEKVGRIVDEARRLSKEGLYDLSPETQGFLNSMLKASMRPSSAPQ